MVEDAYSEAGQSQDLLMPKAACQLPEVPLAWEEASAAAMSRSGAVLAILLAQV